MHWRPTEQSVPMMLGTLVERSERTLDTLAEIKADAKETRAEVQEIRTRLADGDRRFDALDHKIEAKIETLRKPDVEPGEGAAMLAIRWAIALIVAWQTGSLDLVTKLAGLK